MNVFKRLPHISECPTLLNHPTVQVLASKVTCGKRSAVSIDTIRSTVDFSARDMRRELVTSLDAAGPADTNCV